MTAPDMEINHPSSRKILRMRFVDAPRLSSVSMSFCLSRINMVRDPMILNEAMTRMKDSIKKMAHFSDLMIR